MTIARRYRSGKLKDLTPFKLDATGMPVNMPKFKPPAKLAPPLTREERRAMRRVNKACQPMSNLTEGKQDLGSIRHTNVGEV